MLTPYLHEFLMLTLIHLLAVSAPGPDFAVVIRQSISFGRKTAILTSLGIGAGISIHVLYTLLGIGFIIAKSPTVFMLAKIAGALYLTYLGFKLLRSKANTQLNNEIKLDHDKQHNKKAFWLGFITNVLNPKATLFFLAIFTTVVDIHTPLAVQSIYGAWIVLTTAVWFTLVACFFSHQKVRNKFIEHGYWFERVMGLVLLGFAVRLALSMQ